MKFLQTQAPAGLIANLRDLTESNIIKLCYLETADQIADLLTKPVSTKIFRNLVHYLVRPCNTETHH